MIGRRTDVCGRTDVHRNGFGTTSCAPKMAEMHTARDTHLIVAWKNESFDTSPFKATASWCTGLLVKIQTTKIELQLL